MSRENEYALVDADTLRERRRTRQSSPDSDPHELKKQLLDHRFDAVHNRVDGVKRDVETLGEKLDTVITNQAETTLAVAKSDASLKAYGAALALFITMITVAANVLPRLMK